LRVTGRFFGQPLPCKKLPAGKSQTPKALGAVARQQLLLVNGLLDEVARNYLARLHREIAELIRVLEKKQVEPRLFAPGIEGPARNPQTDRAPPDQSRKRDGART
jgi:hypothetical protein